jgi:hypothetical protein
VFRPIRPQPRWQGRSRLISAQLAQGFAKLDTDDDGKLSFEEYSAKAIGRFAKADADRSGALNAAESATTRVQRKPQLKCAPVPPPAPAGEDEG